MTSNHVVEHEHHHALPETTTSHPGNPVPEEPTAIPEYEVVPNVTDQDSSSSANSLSADSLLDSDGASTPHTEPQVDDILEDLKHDPTASIDFTAPAKRNRRGSTKLVSGNSADLRRIFGDEAGTRLLEKSCCGEGCCRVEALQTDPSGSSDAPVIRPDNAAYRHLDLKLGPLSLKSNLTGIVPVPTQTISLQPLAEKAVKESAAKSTVEQHPPKFVTPHPPYDVFSARIDHARELTKPGAEKRTYHFDLDVTDYPEESGKVDFAVGGAIGICAPNPPEMVTEMFELLGTPSFARDKPVLLKTESGRWPTMWGDEMPRELITTRRELLTWCTDLQSYPPTKPLLRLLAEYATAENEKRILMYLASAQGQAAFCDLRTGPYTTVPQLLNAFPSSKPPLAHLLSALQQLMPRFYSLSNDPHIACQRQGSDRRRLVEIAVTVHESSDWRAGQRTGVGSGFFERSARKFIEATKSGVQPSDLDIRVPMFRGMMANPLAREFVADGPMLLIGAGVGIAPFRGFVQRRLRNANCANKVWVLQGVRDQLLDEIYGGEWGVHEDEVKRVVQSRGGEKRYVQEEVRHQADLVWFIINALDGRIFVCGSSKGMGEGVEHALLDVSMDKGRLNKEDAEEFWKQKKESGQYIVDFPTPNLSTLAFHFVCYGRIALAAPVYELMHTTFATARNL
ncbi:MAG: hypothetical protein M1837_004000 [Sclerophora amabilis]|nr:MAG: hypothetical protein M1837_004000 [Sclerophora amabilis]